MTKVLVVDDEPAIANLARLNLVNRGFDVTMVNSGKDALASIAEDPPDVVVLDVMMPGMDGWEVASRIKADPATNRIPILMLTALGFGEEARPEFAAADEYYTKPFDGATLAKIVRGLAER